MKDPRPLSNPAGRSSVRPHDTRQVTQPDPPGQPGSPAARQLVAEVVQASHLATGAPAGAVIALMGLDGSDGAVARRAIGIAAHEDRELVFVQLSRGEELLGNAYYDDLRADDEFKPRKDRAFGADIALREGRADLAAAIEAAWSLGLTAGGWFPTTSGLDGVRVAIDQFGGSVVVAPASVRDPGIGERLRAITAEALGTLGVQLVMAD
jgi:hypothetical protein